MKSALRTASTCLLAATMTACAGASAGVPATPSPAFSLTGTWHGTGVDSGGATVVTWSLVQSGTNVSGTMATQAVDPADGSCNSCHRNKSGTVAGTIAGNALTLSMNFAAGVSGDPTPICSSSFTGTAPDAATRTISVVYTGSDSCEGPLNDGTLAMTHTP